VTAGSQVPRIYGERIDAGALQPVAAGSEHAVKYGGPQRVLPYTNPVFVSSEPLASKVVTSASVCEKPIPKAIRLVRKQFNSQRDLCCDRPRIQRLDRRRSTYRS